MKTYPPLYKKNASGKTLMWKIWIETKNNTTYIISTSGFVGGKIKDPTEREITAKGGRTPIEQAILEADRKHLDKIEKEGFAPETSASTAAATAPQQHIRPMLAKEYTPDSPWVRFPGFVQPKLDGHRCLASITSDGSIKLESRTGKEIENLEHIKKTLQEIYEQNGLPSTFYFDGELYTMDIPFQELSGLLRKKTMTKTEKTASQQIRYFIYDCIDLTLPDLTNQDRHSILAQIITPAISSETPLTLVATEIVHTPEEVDAALKRYLAEGFEGLMYRNMDAPYKIDGRSSDLLKYKLFKDAEFRIVGFKEGKGTNKGAVIWQVVTDAGVVVDVVPNGTIADRRKLFKQAASYIGKMLTVEFFDYTEDGSLRFPKGKAIREPGF